MTSIHSSLSNGHGNQAISLGLDNHDLDRFADVGNQLADAAGDVIRQYFRKSFDIVDKEDLSPVTIADRTAEESMVKIIQEKLPSHAILALPLLYVEKSEQRHKSEGREANRGDIQRQVSAGDGLNRKQVGGLVSICGLSEGYLMTMSVVHIGPNEIRGSRNVLLHRVGEVIVRTAVWFCDDLVLAGLVFV